MILHGTPKFRHETIERKETAVWSQKPGTVLLLATRLFSENSDDVRSGEKHDSLRWTLPVRGLLESSERKMKRDLATLISTDLAFKSAWG
jgi:hypothetical protein